MIKQFKHRYNLLCIDDNKNNLFTLTALLDTVGNINSIEALNAKDALDILLTKHIDLILCDIQMPDINGFELAKMIKSNKRTRDIPIIFVTAVFKSEEFVKEGFELGAVDYITKPIDDNQLLNKITLYLKIFQQQYRVAQSEKRFYDIAQSIGDGIYSIDLEGKTTFINSKALSLLGFKKNELIDKKIHNYIHYKNRDNIAISAKECRIHNAMCDGEIYRSNSEVLVKKDGSFLEIYITTTPLYNDSEIIGSVTIFRDKTNQKKIKVLEYEKIKNQEQIIHSMIDMIEARDSYTAGHTKRVAEYCVLIAKEMHYSHSDIELLRKAAWLHDIGKISTPDSVLLKPGKLNDVEYGLIKEHLNAGYEMLRKIDQYSVISKIMREHHEKYDGSGYPQGLKGDEIRPLSRIMMVADAFDAMTTNRVYKAKKSVEVALLELESLSAIHFHPDVVSAATVALKSIDIDRNITQLPKTVMEKQRFSYFYRDRLTNLYLIDYCELFLMYHVDSKDIYMYDIKLHNFSEYNNRYSWAKGDDFLIEFSNYIDALYDDSVVFRVEGDDFMILNIKKIETIEEDIGRCPLLQGSIVSFSVGEKYISNIKENIGNTSCLSFKSVR